MTPASQRAVELALIGQHVTNATTALDEGRLPQARAYMAEARFLVGRLRGDALIEAGVEADRAVWQESGMVASEIATIPAPGAHRGHGRRRKADGGWLLRFLTRGGQK